MARDPSRLYLPSLWTALAHADWRRVGIQGAAVVVALAIALATPLAVLAQTQPPPPFRIAPTELPDVEPEDAEDEEGVTIATASLRLIVDTDPGVDDAAALIWLFSQPQPWVSLGIVTVAGNTDVASATNNVLLILSWLGQNRVPVVRGADKPLVQVASKANQLIHGPDGLWGISAAFPPVNSKRVATNATRFYCDTLAKRTNRGATVLALGPMTNLAKAIYNCKSSWAGVRIVTLGGAKVGGNQTPVAEYNYWQDPEAAKFVFSKALAYGYTLEQVPEDAFDQFVLSGTDMAQLYTQARPAMFNLLPPLTMYMCQLAQACAYDDFGYPVVDPVTGVPILYQYETSTPTPIPAEDARYPALPDPVAAIYALLPHLGTPQSALVKILAEYMPQYVRGQSIIGLSFEERLAMIADDQELNQLIDLAFTDPDAFFTQLNLIIARDPDNATVVTDVAARWMIDSFLRFVAVAARVSAEASVQVEVIETPADVAPDAENKLLLPMLGD